MVSPGSPPLLALHAGGPWQHQNDGARWGWFRRRERLPRPAPRFGQRLMSPKGPRGRLTYANVVATLALVLAVGGGATALALTLPKNSVHSKQIAKGAVKTSDIGKDAVTG